MNLSGTFVSGEHPPKEQFTL